MSATPVPPRAEIVVDLGAIRHNVARLRELVGDGPALMVVVKADGYGHGMVPVARAAREAGADWLGVATLDEAMALRRAGDTGPLMCWLAVPGEDYRPAISAGVDVSAYSIGQLDEIAAAARSLGTRARVQLKVDTGLSRGGVPLGDWAVAVEHARSLEEHVEVAGIWTHPACADTPEHPANDQQEQAFREALELAEEAGITPALRHFANSAAALNRPSARFDLVRFGIAVYGLTPMPAVASSADLGLRQAMTLRATVALTKTLAKGEGISYGHTFVTDHETDVALVPLGYGDGIPRAASSTAQVGINGRRADLRGIVCMDQVVVEASDVAAGDEVLLFGPGDQGEPTVQEWAEWCGTINYEIVTRMGGRQARRWVG